ncbi:MAG: acyl carrier protein [Bacteroidaceae bacterium]|nr:acyl carrier protein [Bacteroidaceae bacterium]
MMREKTIEKTIKGIIVKEMTIDADSITRDTNLVNDLNADSMSIVNIVTAIESKFKIVFPDDSKITYDGYTLQFLIDGVSSALKEKSAKGVLPRTRKAKVSES